MDYSIRALGASLFIVGMMLLTLYCLYKYAVCQERKNRRVHPVINNRKKSVNTNNST